MRTAIMLAFLLVLTGAAQADEKKSPDPRKKESYTDKVTVRQWAGDKFIDPRDTVAFKGEFKDAPVLYVYTTNTSINPVAKSEITDKDGVVWVVSKSVETTDNFTFYRCHVTKKPAQKKPE